MNYQAAEQPEYAPFAYSLHRVPYMVVMRQDGRFFFAKEKTGRTRDASGRHTVHVEWRPNVEEASEFDEATARKLAARWSDRCVALPAADVRKANRSEAA